MQFYKQWTKLTHLGVEGAENMVVKDSVLDNTCIFCNCGVLTAHSHQARAEELGKVVEIGED